MKEDRQTTKILLARNRLKKLLRCKYNHISWERKDGSKGSSKPRGWSLRNQGQVPQSTISRPWKLADFSQLDSKITWNQWLLPSFHFLTLGMKISVIVNICLFHHCILRAGNLFPSFTGLQMERNFEIRMDHMSFTRTWCKWFRRWDFQMVFRWHFGLGVDAIKLCRSG